MDVLSLGFLVLVVLLGGLVALVADRTGRKLGKKRLTFLHMRPRQTAEFFVVMSGILIPLITVAIVMAASRDVREWLIQGRFARQEAERLKKEREILSSSVQDARKKEADALGELKNVRAELGDLKDEASDYKRQADDTKKSLTGLQEKEKALRKSYERALALQQRAAKDLAEKQKALIAAQGKVTALNKNVVDLNKSYQDLKGNFALLSQQNREAYDENKRINDENVKLQGQLENTRNLLKDANAELDEARQGVEAARLARDRAEADLRAAQLDLIRVQGLAVERQISLRTSPLILRRGDELARVTVRPGLSEAEARMLYQTLLRNARVEAQREGASEALNGQTASLVDLPAENQGVLRAEEQERAFIESITNRKEPGVGIAVALFNAFQGEGVILSLLTLENPLVYKQGQIIAEGPIDGRQTDLLVLNQVSDFFNNRVKEKARKDKMIPIQGRDEFGTVDPDETISLVQQIRNANRPVRLVVYAQEDTRAGEPLKMGFRLR